MEDIENETIIKNINEFKLLIMTQKQYVLTTQHENVLKNMELKYKDEELKKLQDKINKNYVKKKIYKNENKILRDENKILKDENTNLKNQVDFLKNLILLNNTQMNKPFLNQTVNCSEIPKIIEKTIESDIKEQFTIEEIKPKILEKKKVDINKLNMGSVLDELKNKFIKE
jgi:hypothetical protein